MIAQHAGVYLRDELKARGWSQVEFAQIIGRPVQAVNQIINGKRGITAQTAKEFAAAFGGSADYWMRLHTAWLLAQA